MTQKLFVTDAEKLEGLENVIAEPMVELTFDGMQVAFGLFWERRGEVAPYNAAAVSCQMIDDDEHDVGQKIETPERQERQQIDDSI